jgi:hypothetical protein
MKSHFSLILLSTLQCNADCEYCFENKTTDRLTLDRLGEMIRKVLDYMVEKSLASLTIYWQGGEAMLLPPSWYEQANELIQREAEARGKQVFHSLQSNMLAYSSRWNKVIAEMFGNSVGTSLDYPNLHRKLLGQGAGQLQRNLGAAGARSAGGGHRGAGDRRSQSKRPWTSARSGFTAISWMNWASPISRSTPRFRAAKRPPPSKGIAGGGSGKTQPLLSANLADVWLERGYRGACGSARSTPCCNISATNRPPCPASGATTAPMPWFRSMPAATWRNAIAG